MMRKINHILCVTILLLVQHVQATPISYGSLSSNDDGSTEVITDSLNNREWLRWDVLGGAYYTDVLAEISIGGAYEGWQIARSSDAFAFVNALYGTLLPNCGSNEYWEQPCGVAPISLTPLLGDSLNDQLDYAWFLNDSGGNEVGIIGHDENELTVFILQDLESIASTESKERLGPEGDKPISWLLFRETASVPEPTTLTLLSLGLLGLGLSRRKQLH